MNKTIWIIVIAVIVVILGIVGYFVFANKSGTQTGTPTQTQLAVGTNSSQPSATPGASSLKELLASGASQQCTYSDTSGSSTSQGTVYVASGKIRVDFTTSGNTQSVSGHMIYDGQYFYTWTDGSTQGFKMAISSQPTASPSSSANQGVDVNKQINYNCTASTPDSSLFDLPTKVQFSDINSLVPKVPTSVMPASPSANASPGVRSAQCSACDNLPAASRATCRQALGCQ